MATRKVKLFQPYMNWRAIWNAVKVMRSPQLAEGPQVKAFEQEFATYFDLPRALAVNSGTAALELAYEVAGIGPETKFTPVLPARRPISLLPQCHDVFGHGEEPQHGCRDVKRKITKKTKAIVFVHFGETTAD